MAKYIDEVRTSEFATKINATYGKKAIVAQNSVDIATNAANIAQNASDIATNAAAIRANTTSIATNTANIATNAANITNLQAVAFEIDENGDLMPPL